MKVVNFYSEAAWLNPFQVVDSTLYFGWLFPDDLNVNEKKLIRGASPVDFSLSFVVDMVKGNLNINRPLAFKISVLSIILTSLGLNPIHGADFTLASVDVLSAV